MGRIAQITTHPVSVPLKHVLWTAQATPIPLAHGERELTRHTVRDFIASGAIRYVQFDSTRAAGFTEGDREPEPAANERRCRPHTRARSSSTIVASPMRHEA